MLTRSQVNDISTILTNTARKLFGKKLKEVILFGSYARGNASAESDIDIMLLVDMDRESLKKYRNDICRISSETGLKYDILISPVLQSLEEFDNYKNDLPFFKNILLEGVRMYSSSVLCF